MNLYNRLVLGLVEDALSSLSEKYSSLFLNLLGLRSSTRECLQKLTLTQKDSLYCIIVTDYQSS